MRCQVRVLRKIAVKRAENFIGGKLAFDFELNSLDGKALQKKAFRHGFKRMRVGLQRNSLRFGWARMEIP
jgi:hypothetical protein